jgi:hypothetical protein
MADKDIAEMIDEADSDKNGLINYKGNFDTPTKKVLKIFSIYNFLRIPSPVLIPLIF